MRSAAELGPAARGDDVIQAAWQQELLGLFFVLL